MKRLAAGQVAQIPYHLNHAMDNGLTYMNVGKATHDDGSA